MNGKRLGLMAAAGSAALMIGALGFQYLGGLPPCKLCIYQRYPHVLAIIIGVMIFFVPSPILFILGALAAAATMAVGIYHAGVEQKWWLGPDTCTSGAINGLSADELLAKINAAPVVRCDEIPWELFSISMAGWNAIISAGLVILWIRAYRTLA